ncbi:VacJ family lipoprotein [Novosphingobium sp. BL-8A]|uniref:MlaA family lipoprotein n=1 Tax=Novosphingobium sp. BL-8A TaxID=3127639 RepID=UPI003757A63D
MITPLVVPAVLLASPADLPLPNDATVEVGQLPAGTLAAAQTPPVVVVPLPPVVPFVDPAQAANQVPAAPAAEGDLDDFGADSVQVDKDPLEGFNRAMFGVYRAMDKVLWRPLAMGYKTVVPKPVRSGARNALSNLTEPYIFVNFLLQGKPGKAAETFARFVINSTLGIGGLIDVAKTKDFKLPHRPNGFGATLALHGVKAGPYLFVPFVGPTTFRDVLGDTADGSFLPLVVGKPFSTWKYQIVTGVVDGLDMRAEADAELRTLFADAIDPYATLRAVYLQNRAAEIEEVRGRHRAKKVDAAPELDEPLDDPAGSPKASDTPPSPPSDAPELQDPMKDPATN